MCLVFLAVRAHPDFPLVVLFNRDEVYMRPTEAAHWWKDGTDIAGGRDIERGGTWAGVTRRGRLALLTFVRTALSGTGLRSRKSRGAIVSEFLRSDEDASVFLSNLRRDGDDFLPYNLVVGDMEGDLFHYSNVDRRINRLEDGIHGLSNATLNTPWPKVVKGVAGVRRWLATSSEDFHPLLEMMADRRRFPDELLPATGVPIERERALSSLFVDDADYGTRTTTMIRLQQSGAAELFERTHERPGSAVNDVLLPWSILKS